MLEPSVCEEGNEPARGVNAEGGVHAGIIIARSAEIKVADPSLRAMLVEGMTDSTGGLDAQESASA